MFEKPTRASLTNQEKRIAKALLEKKWKNQDVQALINLNRRPTINFARIDSINKNNSQISADKDELDRYIAYKKSFDPQTGLNVFHDERLIKSREAMILAVEIFNSGSLKFKTEIFTVLVCISWTYLIHEYYERKKINYTKRNGDTFSLSIMLKMPECPLSDSVRKNIEAIIKLRNNVEHKILGPHDDYWFGYFQSCCLNFDKTIRALFGEDLTLNKNLSAALQFSKFTIDQAAKTNLFDIPANIKAIDSYLIKNLSYKEVQDSDFNFIAKFKLEKSAKSKANFLIPNSEDSVGKNISNILIESVVSDEKYPFKAGNVVKLVQEKANKSFNMHSHTRAWKLHKVRPQKNSKKPDNTRKEYCVYHRAHDDYTYSQDWVDFLISETLNGKI